MSDTGLPTRQVNRLRTRVGELEDTIRRLEEHRDREIRRRRRNLLVIGVSVSALIHLGLMAYLNMLHRGRPAEPGVQPVSIEFAVIQEPELTQLREMDLDELVPEVTTEDPNENQPTIELEADVSAADLEISPAGAIPTLSGSGGGEGGTLGGGGAGTTFFGVSSYGTRFAYIVDISASMADDRKMDVCLEQLARSIEILPDYAYFYVAFFSSQVELPPMQHGWTRAQDNTVSRFIRWLRQVDPHGGTQPRTAFRQVFSLDERPDVIFFLTDGLIPSDTMATVAALNQRGRRVAVNTIAFGDPSSQEYLKDIARRSGGVYRFVPSEGW